MSRGKKSHPAAGCRQPRRGRVGRAAVAPRKRRARAPDSRIPRPEPQSAPPIRRQPATRLPALGRGLKSVPRAARAALSGAAARFREPARALPVLLGLAVGCQWQGAARVMAPVLEPSNWAASILGIVLLLCLALGPHLPEWVAGPIGALWNRRAGVLARIAGGPDHETDRAGVAAVLCGAAGAACLVQLALVGTYLRFHDYMLQCFFWTQLTFVLMNAAGLALLMGMAWCLQGLILVLLAGGDPARERGNPAGKALVGFAFACAAGGWALDQGISGHQLYLAGALPLFGMAVLCMELRPAARAESDADHSAVDSDAPDLGRADAWLCVGALLAWAMAGVFITGGLIRGEPGEWHTSLIWLLLGIGFGAVGRLRGSGPPAASLSDAGWLLWIAGLVSTGALCLSIWGRCSVAGLIVTGAAMGYALHRLEQASLARLGRERFACAQLVTSVCAGIAVGQAFAHWWALPRLGTSGMIILGILTLLAAAGLLQIYTQDRPGHVRHARLGGVFATLALAILAFPVQARVALQRERDPAAPPASDAWLAAALEQSREACWLAPAGPQEHGPRTIFLRTQARPKADAPASGIIQLVTSQRRFGLVYQCWPQAGAHLPQYSRAWIERLVEAAAPDGLVVLDVPCANLRPEAQEAIAARFVHAAGAPAATARLQGPWGPTIRLAAPVERVRRIAPAQTAAWTELSPGLKSRRDESRRMKVRRRLSATH